MEVYLALGLCAAAAVLAFALGWLVARQREIVRRRSAGADHVLRKVDVLNGALHQAPIALAVVDRFEDLILSNTRAEELDIVKAHRLDVDVWDAVAMTFSTSEETRFHIPAHNAPGRRRVPSVSGRAVFLDGQGEKFVIVFADDDSEHRRMEAARRDFVANVSHELKTPVGAMAVLAEALLESKYDPDSVTYFGERVVGEAHRLGSMVTELIELSRLQGAEKLRDPAPVSIDEVVDEAMRRVTGSVENQSSRLTSDAPSGLEVMGDKTLLVTALSNLISNAINYSPSGTPVVVTRAATGGMVLVRVTDHGIGIAPEHQGRVFERFFRVDKARSRATGGTGLGLAIVKHVVQNHNGQVKLWSRPGMGSTFTLELPAHEEPSDRLDASSTNGPTLREPQPPFRGGESHLAATERVSTHRNGVPREESPQ